MSYILVTTRKTMANPKGEARYLVNPNTESTTTDITQAMQFKDRERLMAAHADLNNPSNWDSLPYRPIQPVHPELVEGPYTGAKA
jgi:cystathionine beta-lyase family protein involved in aluminum resistance